MKACLYPSCDYPIWSHGYCKYHQGERTDEKWLKSQNKAIGQRQPIKWVSPLRASKIVQTAKEDQVFYLKISISRKHVCSYCDAPLPKVLSNYNYDHCFEKSVFPHLRHIEEDVILTCLDCHTAKTAHNYTDRMKEVMYETSRKLIELGLLDEICEPDYYSIKNWLIKPLK